MKTYLASITIQSIVFLPIFLIGCSAERSINEAANERVSRAESEELPKSVRSIVVEESQIKTSAYPKDSCGDSLPEHRRAYPIKVFPIYVSYSEEALSLIKENFCEDAFLNEKDGEKKIQVGTFLRSSITCNNALQLKADLESKINNLKVWQGEHKIIEEPTKALQTKNLYQDSSLIAQKAGLDTVEAQKLLSLEKVTSNDFPPISFILGILVPTYLPEGFEVDELYISEYGQYLIYYKNSIKNQCFSIEGFPLPQIGDAPTDFERIEVQSPAFGLVVIEYTESDWVNGGSYGVF